MSPLYNYINFLDFNNIYLTFFKKLRQRKNLKPLHPNFEYWGLSLKVFNKSVISNYIRKTIV